jgi:hypothetical protein
MTSQNTRRFDAVRPGETLPELAIPITVALIASGAIATRDYFPATTTRTPPGRWARPTSS